MKKLRVQFRKLGSETLIIVVTLPSPVTSKSRFTRDLS